MFYCRFLFIQINIDEVLKIWYHCKISLRLIGEDITMGAIFALGVRAVCILITLTLHEFSRALTSTILGDKKPKKDGRLTLNPIKHFEPIGFILCFASGFGWGKPVETTALYYKNRKAGTLITALVPSLINLLVAFVCGRLSSTLNLKSELLIVFLYYMVHYNVFLAVYNLIPVSPMDGLKVLSVVLPANKYFEYLQHEKMVQMVFLIMLFMGYVGNFISPIAGGVMNIFFGIS